MPDRDRDKAAETTTPMAPEEAESAAADATSAAKQPYDENLSIREMLGWGGMGRVWLGHQENLDREVAIKELHPKRPGGDRERTVARFVREAKISGQLQHPGVVPVYAFGQKPDGTPYYVMKYVHGVTMTEAIERAHAVMPEEALRGRLKLLGALIDVAQAMGFAHARGVIHRDLKPGNIILGDFGETVILDWGLAKRFGEGESAAPEPAPAEEGSGDDLRTRDGAKLGTPAYMSPEQVDPRRGPVGPASDVYALGTILFLLLTGQKPYAGKGAEVMRRIVSDGPSPSPRHRGVSAPPELAAICEKAMQKDPAARFPDATAFAAELAAYRDGRLVGVYAYSRRELFRRFLARNKAALAAAAVIVLTIIAAAVVSTKFAIEARQAQARAEKALVDVSNLAGEASFLARELAQSLERATTGLTRELAAAARGNGVREMERRLPAAFAAVRAAHGGIEALAIVAPDGEFLAITPEDAPHLRDIPIARRAEFVAAARKERAVIAGPILAGGEGRFAFAVPLGGKTALTAFVRAEALSIPFDIEPTSSAYQVWCLEEDGRIAYDEDPAQVGRMLFTDAMYADFPELLALGAKIQSEPWGVGYYQFLAKDGTTVVHKIAAWAAFTPAPGRTWKIVIAHPYTVRKG